MPVNIDLSFNFSSDLNESLKMLHKLKNATIEYFKNPGEDDVLMQNDEYKAIAAFLKDLKWAYCHKESLWRDAEWADDKPPSKEEYFNFIDSAYNLFCSDSAFISVVARKAPEVIQYACEELCNMKAFILATLRENAEIYQYLNPAMQADYDITELAVSICSYQLQFAPKVYRDNPTLARIAIGKWSDIRAVQAISENLRRTDKALALKAVKNNGNALKYFPAFNDDEDVVRAALEETRMFALMPYVSERLKKDEAIVLLAIKRNPCNYLYLDESLQVKPSIIRAVLRCSSVGSIPTMYLPYTPYPCPYILIPNEFQRQEEYIKLAIAHSPNTIYHLPKALKQDEALMLYAVQQHPRAYQLLCHKFKNNPIFQITALIGNRHVVYREDFYCSDADNKSEIQALRKIEDKEQRKIEGERLLAVVREARSRKQSEEIERQKANERKHKAYLKAKRQISSIKEATTNFLSTKKHSIKGFVGSHFTIGSTAKEIQAARKVLAAIENGESFTVIQNLMGAATMLSGDGSASYKQFVFKALAANATNEMQERAFATTHFGV